MLAVMAVLVGFGVNDVGARRATTWKCGTTKRYWSSSCGAIGSATSRHCSEGGRLVNPNSCWFLFSAPSIHLLFMAKAIAPVLFAHLLPQAYRHTHAHTHAHMHAQTHVLLLFSETQSTTGITHFERGSRACGFLLMGCSSLCQQEEIACQPGRVTFVSPTASATINSTAHEVFFIACADLLSLFSFHLLPPPLPFLFCLALLFRTPFW